MKNFWMIVVLLPSLLTAQTLEQQLKRAIEAGVLPQNFQNPTGPVQGLAPKEALSGNAAQGISSAVALIPYIEEVRVGSLSTFFLKGYGRQPEQYGIWNAIPFVVLNNDNMELRFGLIFEHRQIGFVPDDWINTTLTGAGKPEISFLVPKTKTFLNFSRGTSQWRSTVLLTPAQIEALAAYTNTLNSDPNDPDAQIYTVTHRFIDSSTRLYLIGARHKDFFTVMLKLYGDIALNKNVKTFQNSFAFPKNGFFDDLVLQEVTTQTTNVETTITTIIEEEAAEEEYTEEEYSEEDVSGDEAYSEEDAEYSEEEYTEEFTE